MIIVLVTAAIGAVVIMVFLTRLLRSIKMVESASTRAAQEVARLRQQVERGNGSIEPPAPS